MGLCCGGGGGRVHRASRHCGCPFSLEVLDRILIIRRAGRAGRLAGCLLCTGWLGLLGDLGLDLGSNLLLDQFGGSLQVGSGDSNAV